MVVVVAALGAVVVVVLVGSAADDALDDAEPEVEEVVDGEVVAELPEVEEPEGWLVAVDEWAVDSVPTSSPSPMALAIAATPIAAVVRRTRDIARSRARTVGSGIGLFRRGWSAMS